MINRPLIKFIKHLISLCLFLDTLYNTCSFYLEIADSEIDEGQGNEGWRETRERGQFWWVRVFVGKGIRRGLRNDFTRATAIGWPSSSPEQLHFPSSRSFWWTVLPAEARSHVRQKLNDQNKDTCDKDIYVKCVSSTMSSRQPYPKTFLFIKKFEIHVYSHDVPGFFAMNFCLWIRASLKSKDLGTTKKLYEEKICWECKSSSILCKE